MSPITLSVSQCETAETDLPSSVKRLVMHVPSAPITGNL